MRETLFFNKNNFIVIPDESENYVIYLLDKFDNGNQNIFEVNNETVYYYLKISTVELPNNFWGYGYKSNILNYEDRPVFGAKINNYRSELEALQACLSYIKRSPLTNDFYGKKILLKFENFINPKNLFDNI